MLTHQALISSKSVSQGWEVAQRESEHQERFLHQAESEVEAESFSAKTVAAALLQRFHSVIWLTSAAASDLILERRQFNY